MRRKKKNTENEFIKIYPENGTFSTQAVTDSTERYEKTNVAKPSDENVEINRDWVNFNKK